MLDLKTLDTQTLNKYLFKLLLSPSSSEYSIVPLIKHSSKFSNLIDSNGKRINFEDTIGNVYELSKGNTCSVLYADNMFTYVVTSKGQLLASTYSLLEQGKVFHGWIENMYPVTKICEYFGNDEQTFRSRIREAIRNGKELSGSLVKESIELASVSYVKKAYPQIKSFKLVIRGENIVDSLFKYECKNGERGLSTYKDMQSFLYTGSSTSETKEG